MGCCDSSGVCQLGQSAASCGASGAQCTPCGAGLTCTLGVCVPGGGSGGGSSGTGGGSSGNGGGFTPGTGKSELLSGTRLRAINLIGQDGSKAPYSVYGYSGFFWDTQLSTYCSNTWAQFIAP